MQQKTLKKIMVLRTHAHNDSVSGERACTGFIHHRNGKEWDM